MPAPVQVLLSEEISGSIRKLKVCLQISPPEILVILVSFFVNIQVNFPTFVTIYIGLFHPLKG